MLYLSGCDRLGPHKPATELQQGWNAGDFNRWAYGGQGSRLMPMDWFTEMLRTDGTGKFADPAYLDRFGFIAPAPGATRPTNRPFARTEGWTFGII